MQCAYLMTHDEVASSSAQDRHGSVNIAENWLVTLGWREIIGGYNTPDTIVAVLELT